MSTELKEVEKQDETEILQPTYEEATVTIGRAEDGTEMVFVQKPLSFFGKMDFFAVMGRALDNAMSGPDGISLADLMDVPEKASDIQDADMFIRGIAKLAMSAPEILGDLYCVILACPRGRRDFAKEVMALPEDQGGFSDEEGVAVLERFVDQNWEVLVGFFSQHLAGLAKNVGEKMGAASQPSKPSKSTRASTRKRSKS